MKKNVEESRRVARLVGAKANLCWRNAVDVVYNVPEYAEATYVEGLVLNPRTPTVVQEHGWIEKECEIVDPTLPELELRYFPAIKWAGILDIVVMEGRHQSLPFFRTSEYTTQAVCQAMETARCDALTWAETAVPEGDNEQ